MTTLKPSNGEDSLRHQLLQNLQQLAQRRQLR